MNIELLGLVLLSSLVVSILSFCFIQKTKCYINKNKYLIIYSLIINLLFSMFFCYCFTKIDFLSSFWSGIISFLVSDTLYKMLSNRYERE